MGTCTGMQQLFLIMGVFWALTVTAAPVSFQGAVANHMVYEEDGLTISELLQANLDKYVELMNAARSGGASFLVFPEFGLAPFGTTNRTTLSETAERIGPLGGVPCDDFTVEQQQTSPILFQMSCAAKETAVSVLVNMIDYVPCSALDDGCPDDGFYLYNTDVGMSAEGAFQAKYHKSHEYWGLRPQFNVPALPDYQTWQVEGTGSTLFGIFTCYDIFHKQPAKQYVADGLHHFLYPVQMGIIGDVTELALWSRREAATLWAANTCLRSSTKSEPDCSAVFVHGKKQEGQLVQGALGGSVLVVSVSASAK